MKSLRMKKKKTYLRVKPLQKMICTGVNLVWVTQALVTVCEDRGKSLQTRMQWVLPHYRAELQDWVGSGSLPPSGMGRFHRVSFRSPQNHPVTPFHSPCSATSESSCHEEAFFAGLLKVTQICLPVVRRIHLSDCRVTGCEEDKCDGGGGMRNCSIFTFISTSLSCKFHFQSESTL